MGDDPSRDTDSKPDAPPAPEELQFPLTIVDRLVLSQTDEEFKKHDWQELRQIIGRNDLSALKRKPSDLQRYMKWTAEKTTQHGSITNFILANRLPKTWGSPPFVPASLTPLEDGTDYKALLNDWPYGLQEDITHIVVWSRTPIPTDAQTGDLTDESRAQVAEFVKRYFVEALGEGGEEKVLWFKNWVSLQSVRTLEHFHVLVRDVDDDTLERWTGERPKRSG
ncbi:hypothetical protein DCS_02921 [Drechmeria coniospora]|uniref:N-acetylglucosamine-induced protein 1 n=1 Tax=Drechmeria coniospora TaxID=98403 RepID=A0A151GXE9_DRECN|nr:hypothetical protein DCS_02921 [Drechmeria coniospora]KYK61777.1 hypothetical protein DCS_02921 [Drechmeria coniospora]ODA82585.1 hypothetical protein RJ55_01092 [Drechmeria coniospora]